MKEAFDIDKHIDELTVDGLEYFHSVIPSITEFRIKRNDEGHKGTITFSNGTHAYTFENISVCCFGHLMMDLEVKAAAQMIRQFMRELRDFHG